MEKLISGRSHLPFVPESFILPPESRPGRTKFPPCDSIPVIDLGGQLGFDRAQLVKQIMQASQEFGFFQVFYILQSFFFFFIFSRQIHIPIIRDIPYNRSWIPVIIHAPSSFGRGLLFGSMRYLSLIRIMFLLLLHS